MFHILCRRVKIPRYKGPKQDGGGWSRLEEVGGGWRRLEEVREGLRRSEKVG